MNRIKLIELIKEVIKESQLSEREGRDIGGGIMVDDEGNLTGQEVKFLWDEYYGKQQNFGRFMDALVKTILFDKQRENPGIDPKTLDQEIRDEMYNLARKYEQNWEANRKYKQSKRRY